MASIKLIIFLILISFSHFAYTSETSTYDFKWLDPDKEVYVLQNRKFRKLDNFYIGFGGGITTSGAFVDTTVLQARMGYYFHEEWGIEAVYSKNSAEENDTYLQLDQLSTVPYAQFIQSYYGAMLMWSPFYAKINTFDKILYFDWFFGVGLASVNEETNAGDFILQNNQKRRDSNTRTALMWDTGWKFYASELISLRVDLTALHYQAPSAVANSSSSGRSVSGEDTWYHNYDLTASINFAF